MKPIFRINQTLRFMPASMTLAKLALTIKESKAKTMHTKLINACIMITEALINVCSVGFETEKLIIH